MQVVDDRDQTGATRNRAKCVGNLTEEWEAASSVGHVRGSQAGGRLSELLEYLQPRSVRRCALTLEAGAPRGGHAQVTCLSGHGMGEGGLAKTGVTVDQDHAAAAGVDLCEPAIDVSTFLTAADQEAARHVITLAKPPANCVHRDHRGCWPFWVLGHEYRGECFPRCRRRTPLLALPGSSISAEAHMYAVVGIWTTDESRRDEQDRGLRDEVIPIVAAHPGFVAGYWMRDPETGKGYTTVVLDSAAAATAFKAFVVGRAQEAAQVGLTNDVLAVAEVLAHTNKS
jgi:hypothetical protein